MKNFLIIIIFLFPVLSFAEEEHWINIDSNNVRLRLSLSCADEMNCISISQYMGVWGSFIRRTTDGGQSWEDVVVDTLKFDEKYFPNPFLKVSYPDTNLCIVSCDSGVALRSTDKGETWTKFEYGKDQIHYIKMLDRNYGIRLTNYHGSSKFTLYKTYDGALSWIEVKIPDQYKWKTAYSTSMPGQDIIIFYTNSEEGRELLKTDDGGATWSLSEAPWNCNVISFINSEIGWAAGGYSDVSNGGYKQIVYYTNNGGKNWELRRDTNARAGWIKDMKFVDENNGVIISGDRTAFWTSDGGKSWRVNNITVEAQPKFTQVECLSTSSAFITGTNGTVYKYIPGKVGITERDTYINEIKVYPNPANIGSEINIELVSPNTITAKIDIIDILGAHLYSVFHGSIQPGMNKYSIDIDDGRFNSGTYFLRCIYGPMIEVRPIIITN